MKPVLLSTIFFLMMSVCLAQSFEGKVIYQCSYKSKVPNVTDEQFNTLMGATMEYYMKGGDYKINTNGTFFQWQLYLNKDNKLYNKMSNSPTIFWLDGALRADELVKTEANKGVLDILGNNCDEIVLTLKNGTEKYYFTTKYKVDAKLYENHKFGNWSDYLAKSGSLPLKMIIDNQQYVLECAAAEVSPMKVDEKMFALPPDSKVEKSPY